MRNFGDDLYNFWLVLGSQVLRLETSKDRYSEGTKVLRWSAWSIEKEQKYPGMNSVSRGFFHFPWPHPISNVSLSWHEIVNSRQPKQCLSNQAWSLVSRHHILDVWPDPSIELVTTSNNSDPTIIEFGRFLRETRGLCLKSIFQSGENFVGILWDVWIFSSPTWTIIKSPGLECPEIVIS